MATEVVKTVRASSGDYPSLSAWEAGEQRDLVSVDEIAVAECYNDWPSGLDDQLIIDGWITDPTRYCKVTVADGHRHNGIPGAGFHVKPPSMANFTGIIRSDSDYSRFEYLDAQNLVNARCFCYLARGQACQIEQGIGISNATLNSVLIWGASSAGGYHRQPDLVVRNSIFIQKGNADRGALQNDTGRNYATFDNCVLVLSGGTEGYFGPSTAPSESTLRNFVVFNDGTLAESYLYSGLGNYSSACSNNASSDGVATPPPGTSPLAADVVAGDFADAASDDFHITTGSQLYQQGIDLSGNFTTDIDGDTWQVPWSIGADEPVSGTVGIIYWSVYPSGQPDPTATEIINETVPNGFFGNDIAPTGTTVDFTGTEITGLTPNTSYKMAGVWHDTVDTSNVDITGAWSTLPIAAYDETARIDATVTVTANETYAGPAYNETARVDATVTVTATETFGTSYNETARVDATVTITAKETYQAPEYSENALVSATMVVTATESFGTSFQETARIDASMLVTAVETYTPPIPAYDEKAQVEVNCTVTVAETFIGPSYNETSRIDASMLVTATESFGTAYNETARVDASMLVTANEVWAPPSYTEKALVETLCVVTAREIFDTPSRLPEGISVLSAERIGGFIARKI